MTELEPIGSETKWAGTIVRVGIERFRRAGGKEVEREKVWHAGAVGILAVDERHVWLTRQPREAAGLPASLEVPAGKLDVPGEAPLASAQRELAEEIGKQAAAWRELFCFYTSPGFTDERVWLYLATDLSDTIETAEAEEAKKKKDKPGEHGKGELLVRHVVSHMSGQPSFRAPVSVSLSRLENWSGRFSPPTQAAICPFFPPMYKCCICGNWYLASLSPPLIPSKLSCDVAIV